MNKRKRKKKKNYLLWDKSALTSLNEDQRKVLDSKHTMLYPPILFAEIARHGLDTPNALFNFKNTIDVTYWMQRAKMDLLVGESSGHYNIGKKIPVTTVYEHPVADLKDLEKQAKGVVREMEVKEEILKKHFSLIRNNPSRLIELAIDHREIPDEKILREFNRAVRQSQAVRQFGQNYPPIASAALIGGGRENVSYIRELLDSYQGGCDMFYSVNTLERAQRWVEQVIYTDAESILDFLCNKGTVIPLSVEERSEIFNRFRKEGKPHINEFAPYAKVATHLYLTIFLYLVELEANPPPQGALRDFEYLYYATDANVIFISGDDWHKKCIEEIPLLKNIQDNFKFLPHINKNKEERKRVLNSIGINI